MLMDGGRDQILFGRSRKSRQTDQNDTGGDLLLTEYQFAEILVSGQEQGDGAGSLAQDNVVQETGLQLSNGDDVVTILAQAIHDGLIDAFVCQKVHVPVCRVG